MDALYHNTSSELVSTIQITTGVSYNYKTVYRTQIPYIAIDDVLIVTGDGQCRQNLNYVCQVTSGILLSPTESLDITNPLNKVIIPNSGYNIDLTVHYGKFPKSRVWKSDAVYQNYYLHFYWYFASTNAGVSDFMDVIQGYGYLSCLQLRNCISH
jgi:hypothetical protein